MKIGNTSFSEDLIKALKGKTAEEIAALRPNLHPRVIEEFLKIHPAEKPKRKSKAKKEEDSND